MGSIKSNWPVDTKHSGASVNSGMVWQDLGFQPRGQEKSRLSNTGHPSMYDMTTMSGLAFWKENVRSEAVWCSMVLRYLQHPGESHGDSDSVGLAWA